MGSAARIGDPLPDTSQRLLRLAAAKWLGPPSQVYRVERLTKGTFLILYELEGEARYAVAAGESPEEWAPGEIADGPGWPVI